MEKENSRHMGSCGNLCKAIRRISHRTPSPPEKAANFPSKPEFKKHHETMKQGQAHNNHPESSEAAEAVPVPPKNEPEALTPANMGGGKSSGHGRSKSNSNIAKLRVDKEEHKKTGINIEDRFTDFINRSKMKLRTTSSLKDGRNATESHTGSGHPASVSRKHSNVPGKDKFTEYINRAKMKLRSTSSIGVGKYKSFK